MLSFIGRKIFYILSFSLLISFFFISRPNIIFAQGCGIECGTGGACDASLSCYNNVVCTSGGGGSCPSCTSDDGRPGGCTASMNCPGDHQGGTGTCSGYDICCAPPPPGDGGTGDCSDVCVDSSDCLDSPINLQCTNQVCTDTNTCPPCQGDSGYYGSCLTDAVCSGTGHNAGDGGGGCTGGTICCTNAPSSESCTITATPPFLPSADFPVQLTSSEDPGTTYRILSSPSGCNGSCLGDHQLDSSSQINCTMACAYQGYVTYTITATHGAVSCSTTVEVVNEPGPPCTGDSGYAGWCVVIACPQNTAPDGHDACVEPSAQCCVPDQYFIPGGSLSVNWNALVPIGTPNFHADDTVGDIVSAMVPYAFFLAGFLVLIFIVAGGYQVLTSQGDPKAMAQGRDKITYAIVGLIIIFISYWILRLAGYILNLSQLTFIFQ